MIFILKPRIKNAYCNQFLGRWRCTNSNLAFFRSGERWSTGNWSADRPMGPYRNCFKIGRSCVVWAWFWPAHERDHDSRSSSLPLLCTQVTSAAPTEMVRRVLWSRWLAESVIWSDDAHVYQYALLRFFVAVWCRWCVRLWLWGRIAVCTHTRWICVPGSAPSSHQLT